MKHISIALLLGLAYGLGACSPDDNNEGIMGLGRDGGTDSDDNDSDDGGSQTADSGVGASDSGVASPDSGLANPDDGGTEDGDPGLTPDAPIGYYGVIASDYTSTSISLLSGEDGSVLAQDFINSGSASTGLVTALSGDVVLPTRSGDPEVLTLVDRFRTDVITRVDIFDGTILGQVKTHNPNDEESAAFSSNPHDYVYFDQDEAWVTRFEPNTNVGDDHPDQGIDLLRVNPSTFEREGRISLWSLNGEGERVNPDTSATETVPVYARPSGMVRLGDKLVVGLSRLSLTFDARDEGMVAVVTPADNSVEAVPLPGLENCGTVVPVPNDPTRVLVSCTGWYRGDPREAAGLVLLHFEDETVELEQVWRGAEHAEAPLAVRNPISLGGTRAFAYVEGAAAVEDENGTLVTPQTADRGFIVDIATGEQTLLFEAAGRYVIGSGSYNPVSGQLLIPDASTDSERRPIAGVRIFEEDSSSEAFMPTTVLKIHDILPVRMVRPL